MLSRGPGVLFLANKVLCSALCPWCTSVTMLKVESMPCAKWQLYQSLKDYLNLCYWGFFLIFFIKLLNFASVLIDVPGASSYWTSSLHREDTDVLYFWRQGSVLHYTTHISNFRFSILNLQIIKILSSKWHDFLNTRWDLTL